MSRSMEEWVEAIWVPGIMQNTMEFSHFCIGPWPDCSHAYHFRPIHFRNKL